MNGDVHDASRERKDLYWPEVMVPTGMLKILLYSYFSFFVTRKTYAIRLRNPPRSTTFSQPESTGKDKIKPT